MLNKNKENDHSRLKISELDMFLTSEERQGIHGFDLLLYAVKLYRKNIIGVILVPAILFSILQGISEVELGVPSVLLQLGSEVAASWLFVVAGLLLFYKISKRDHTKRQLYAQAFYNLPKVFVCQLFIGVLIEVALISYRGFEATGDIAGLIAAAMFLLCSATLFWAPFYCLYEGCVDRKFIDSLPKASDLDPAQRFYQYRSIVFAAKNLMDLGFSRGFNFSRRHIPLTAICILLTLVVIMLPKVLIAYSFGVYGNAFGRSLYFFIRAIFNSIFIAGGCSVVFLCSQPRAALTELGAHPEIDDFLTKTKPNISSSSNKRKRTIISLFIIAGVSWYCLANYMSNFLDELYSLPDSLRVQQLDSKIVENNLTIKFELTDEIDHFKWLPSFSFFIEEVTNEPSLEELISSEIKLLPSSEKIKAIGLNELELFWSNGSPLSIDKINFASDRLVEDELYDGVIILSLKFDLREFEEIEKQLAISNRNFISRKTVSDVVSTGPSSRREVFARTEDEDLQKLDSHYANEGSLEDERDAGEELSLKKNYNLLFINKMGRKYRIFRVDLDLQGN